MEAKNKTVPKRKVNKPKVYILFGKNGKPNITLTIDDLVPVPQKNSFDFYQLAELINYKDYEPDWKQPMKDDYDLLYNAFENKGHDFFKIMGHPIIVMPGNYIYPCILTEAQIINGFKIQ